jgi:osmotically-inducible protein OsmY
MKTITLMAAFSGWALAAAAQDIPEPLKPAHGDSSQQIEFNKDPKQTRLEPTTRIITNATGAAAVAQVGSKTVDDDLRQRVTVALSTGSIGTQGVLPANQTTDIQVTVTNRHVTLRGDVANPKSKEAIGKRVAKLDGVLGVHNELTVNPKAKPARADLVKPDGFSSGTNDPGRTQK